MSIKHFLKQIPFLKSAYYFINPNKKTTRYWIHKYLPNNNLQVIQIGSNDGVTGDTLHQLIIQKTKWQVLFVEPVPHLFKLLKKNYGLLNRFKFENAAINESGNDQLFYQISDEAYKAIPNLSKNYNQIGSFSKTHVQKLSPKELHQYIIATKVSCLSLYALLKKHAITSIDLLQIDAEGYDWRILSKLNLELYKPRIIVFEMLNLTESEKSEAIKFLSGLYHVFTFGINYLCIRKDILKQTDFKTLSNIGS